MPLATTESHPQARHAQFRRDIKNPVRGFPHTFNSCVVLSNPADPCVEVTEPRVTECTEMWKLLFDLNQGAKLDFAHPINRGDSPHAGLNLSGSCCFLKMQSYLAGKQMNFFVSSGLKEMEKKEGHQEGTNL